MIIDLLLIAAVFVFLGLNMLFELSEMHSQKEHFAKAGQRKHE